MALTITYVPGYIWTVGELITEGKLNLAANPTIDLEGSINSTSIADGAVTTAKLAAGALSADATGRSKMADQFLLAAKLGSDVAGAGLTGGAGAAIALDPNGMLAALAGVIAASRNLVAQNNGAAPASKVTVTADEVLLKNSSGNPHLASGVNVTADITVSGANGLDTGSEAVSTWYYIWVIAKTDGTLGALLSTATAIGSLTLPSGYVYAALVGQVYNSSSKDFLAFYQQDREIFVNDTMALYNRAAVTADTYESYQSGGTGGSSLETLASLTHSGTTATATHTAHGFIVGQYITISGATPSTYNGTWLITGASANNFNFILPSDPGADATGTITAQALPVDLRTLIPPNAKRLRGSMGCCSASNGQIVTVAADANGLGALSGGGSGASATSANFSAVGSYNIPLKTAQTFYWKASSTTTRSEVNISGYSI
jgi:hypothetical protein